MTDKQWTDLIAVVNGKPSEKIPTGFIIDCPWLPNWYGIKIIDYFTSDELWFSANMKAIETFPETWFLPGFWSEYGMCTEPSAFGARCLFYENEFPFAEKTIFASEDIDKIVKPNPRTDGLLPFMLNRLKLMQPRIESTGHHIRFSVSRGPLNIATFLMGVSEFMMACLMDAERVHKLLGVITEFLVEWQEIQRKTFPTIDGILVLDDIVGFIGTEEFKEFGMPYLKQIYDIPVSVKFFHNDAECEASVALYPEIGINLYNPGIQTTVNKIKELTQNKMAVLGSIPPRDVLANGTVQEVEQAVDQQLKELAQKDRFILSCAGGMPPEVSTENIRALIDINARHA
jgi:uroporphyrinogen-III decarboxylase